MKFKDIIDGLRDGKRYTCKRWHNKKVYIRLQDYPIPFQGYLKMFILTDETRETVVQFTPSVENIFDDGWIEVK